MATSFLKSVQQANTDTVAATSLMAEVDTVDTTETWTRSDKYLWYEEYSDSNYSYVDELKNIVVDSKQINITQESKSQFIPFQMNRYYDGVDLMGKSLLIRFENKNKKGDYDVPVNVEYSDSKIRFGWLVSKNATAVEGTVLFEIQATGTTSKGDEYTFKTRPNGKLNIEKSLAGDGIIEPSTDWITTFLTQVNEKVADAQSAAQEAVTSAQNAETYAQAASQSASDAQQAVNNAKTELEASVETAVTEKIATALYAYYTSEEVDAIIANIDISDQLTEINNKIDNIDGLANFKVEYDGSTMTFYNGETVMYTIPINSDPSTEWTTAYTKTVEDKIATAKTEIETELTNYKTTTDADLESIHSEIDGLPETLQNDYYN